MSKYETTWKVTFQLFRNYIEMTDGKFYVIKFASNNVGDIITSHKKFSEAVHTTLQAVDEVMVSAPAGWYVAIWQRHKDGTCHRVGYNERWNEAFALGK